MFVIEENGIPDLNTKNIDGKRHYLVPDPRSGEESALAYPSITTLLGWYSGPGIAQWRKKVGYETANKITTQAARRGTSVHKIVEDYITNQISEDYLRSVMPTYHADFLKFQKLIDENLGTIYGIETALWSHEYHVAGRSDCIAEWDGKMSIVDWKTSRKVKKREHVENYFLQGTFYACAYTELTGTEVDYLNIVMVPENEEPVIFTENIHDWKDLLYKRVTKWYKEVKNLTFVENVV